jgi:hypothetical protein
MTTTEATTITKLTYRVTENQTALALGGLTIAAKRGWEAIVDRANGERLYLSRLDGEDRWTVDGRIPAGTAMPTFMNGWGSRCTIPSYASRVVADMLDDATKAAS